MKRDLTPTARAALLFAIDNLGPEGAAIELARMLDFEPDVREIITQMLKKAQIQGYAEGYQIAREG